MNVTRIQELVRAQSGEDPRSYEVADLAGLEGFLANQDVAEYLQHCLPGNTYEASEVRVIDLDRIKGEMCDGAAPGGLGIWSSLAPLAAMRSASTQQAAFSGRTTEVLARTK